MFESACIIPEPSIFLIKSIVLRNPHSELVRKDVTDELTIHLYAQRRGIGVHRRGRKSGIASDEGWLEGGTKEEEEKENFFPQYLSISRRMHNPAKLEGIYSSPVKPRRTRGRGVE